MGGGYKANFFHSAILSNHCLCLPIEHHIHIWQVLPQLSCGDTRQIWKYFKVPNRYICQNKNLLNGEISQHSLSTPHPIFELLWILSPPPQQPPFTPTPINHPLSSNRQCTISKWHFYPKDTNTFYSHSLSNRSSWLTNMMYKLLTSNSNTSQ